ncbi:50S ribosomal protein L9 [uncultured Parasphingorhabdus sp.]|uniref:50S ribosomal protein L9 n=1 Tax=uncultured Parasphingorhabdus sp. TaxID=2709694 RepID=UPI0030D7D6E0|tara:strand:- start:5579 stop:6244 length:666 start_codon:yes stop_codon:yes gene_type:complete
MDIILLERVEKLGSIGDIVTVKNGYARNFLLPNKKALRANAANKKVFEANRKQIEADNETKRKEAEAASGSIEGKQIVLIRASSASGQLYGSVSVRDIVEALNADGKGTVVEKSMVILEKPIKTLGVFDVRVRLHPEVNVNIQANVARSDDEADMQKDGVDVIAQMFEDDQAELAATALSADSEDAGEEVEGEEAVDAAAEVEAAPEATETEEQDETATKE